MMISVKTFMHQKQTLVKISGPEIIFAERHTPEPPPSTPHLSSGNGVARLPGRNSGQKGQKGPQKKNFWPNFG
jgi:hypothetical protein